ncbi:hypothetical protein B0H10DRAFT_1087670 [Mycena sp. CBHHK59/15]|nr:hypothetical protein B0H10DRAFT_1087670 [Mycena sp. CBHHK59/15]
MVARLWYWQACKSGSDQPDWNYRGMLSLFFELFDPTQPSSDLLGQSELSADTLAHGRILNLRSFKKVLADPAMLAEVDYGFGSQVLQFMFHPSLFDALLARNSIRHVTRLLRTLVSRQTPSKDDTVIARWISVVMEYLLNRMDQSDRVTWVTQAIDAGLLIALLNSSKWTAHMSELEDQTRVQIVKTILFPYLGFLSVVRSVGRALKKVERKGYVAQSGPFGDAWATFRQLAHIRVAFAGEEALTPDSCQCNRCRRVSGPHVDIFLCDGCASVGYCSRLCQKKDWKQGHREICKDIQKRRQDGLVFECSKVDFTFAIRCLRQDLRDDYRTFLDTPGFLDPILPIITVDYREHPSVPYASSNRPDVEIGDNQLCVLVCINSYDWAGLELPLDHTLSGNRMKQLEDALRRIDQKDDMCTVTTYM